MENEIIQIKYVQVDWWNRPIFKPVDKTKKYYLSDVNNLFNYDTSEEEIKKFYKNLKPLNDYITYHGRTVDIDPHGGKLKADLELV